MKIQVPKDGSKWAGVSDRERFHVVDTIELEGHTWVHYINETTAQEYSCYVESFLQRFRELPE